MILDFKMNYLLSNIAPFLLKVKRKIGLWHKKTAGLYRLAEKTKMKQDGENRF